jgi:hypothetical protein
LGKKELTIAAALKAAEPRPPLESQPDQKKNYAERLSRALAIEVSNALRPKFRGITPSADGKGQESRARTGKGVKKLDVNYSTTELGLGLGVSIKTINYRDQTTNRYTKNYTRADNELRAEAADYHIRQPYAVLAALIFLPVDSCNDGSRSNPSSFGAAVKSFRHRTDRSGPTDEVQLFERVFIGLYSFSEADFGEVHFFDVMNKPRKIGLPAPASILSFSQVIAEIWHAYADRNDPPFEWDE